MTKRPILIHFHLFKNAGTSIDKILQKNFGERWTEIEGDGGKKLTIDNLIKFIRENPQYDAISSHTAVVTVPELDDIEIIPIVFYRHPLDRIRSAYDFERNQVEETPGSVNAKQGSFEDYMKWRLSTANPWQVSNFHAFRLKDFHRFTPAKQRHLFLPHAMEALKALPVIGLVEFFDESIAKFEDYIQKYFPDFQGESIHENVSVGSSLKHSKNIKKFKRRIGKKVFQHLVEVNAMDLELYSYVKERYV